MQVGGSFDEQAEGAAVDVASNGDLILAWKLEGDVDAGRGRVEGPAMVISRIDTKGRALWVSILRPTSCEQPDYARVRADPNGSVFIAAGTYKHGPLCVVKLDSSGKVRWSRVINDAYGLPQIDVDSRERVVVGVRRHDGKPNFVTALAANGSTRWRKALSFIPRRVRVTNAGNVIIVGAKADSLLLLTLDEHGAVQWEKAFPHRGRWRPSKTMYLGIDKRSGAATVGWRERNLELTRFSPRGEELWSRSVAVYATGTAFMEGDERGNVAVVAEQKYGSVEARMSSWSASVFSSDGQPMDSFTLSSTRGLYVTGIALGRSVVGIVGELSGDLKLRGSVTASTQCRMETFRSYHHASVIEDEREVCATAGFVANYRI